MANNPPAYPYYANDFNGDTATWTNEEVGIYQRLLNYEWVNGWNPGEGLPDDPERLCRIARCGAKKFQKSWQIISKKFSKNDEGFLINRRMEEEREIQRQYRESQSESGKRGVEAKRKKGIYPFNQSSNPLSNPSTDPATGNQALQSSSSSSKDKERKKETKTFYRSNVLLTKKEHQTLIEKHGQEKTKWLLFKLGTWKAAKGQTYKSDYAAINMWVIKAWDKEHGSAQGSQLPPLVGSPEWLKEHPE